MSDSLRALKAARLKSLMNRADVPFEAGLEPKVEAFEPGLEPEVKAHEAVPAPKVVPHEAMDSLGVIKKHKAMDLPSKEYLPGLEPKSGIHSPLDSLEVKPFQPGLEPKVRKYSPIKNYLNKGK